MAFFLRRNSTKSENGEKNACLGPKHCPAAGRLWQNANLWRRMSLIHKLDYFDNALLKKPQGKILEGNINISEWPVAPGGSQLAPKCCCLEALCKNLITFCQFTLSLGGQSGASVRIPPLWAGGRLEGQMYPNMEGPPSRRQCGSSEWCVRALPTIHCNFMLREQVGGLQWDLLWQARGLIFFAKKTGAVSRKGLRWTFDKCHTFHFWICLFLTGVHFHFLIGVHFTSVS